MKEILINRGLDEQTARDQAYSNVLRKLQKELESVYMQRLTWMVQLKNDPIHRKIMQTKNALMKNDDFDPEEAMEAAIDKRKFLIKRLLRPISCSLHGRDNKVYFVELMNKVSFSFQFLINLSNTYLSLVSSLEGYINAMAHEQINEQVLIYKKL